MNNCGLADILATLPHRPPMLLVDEVRLLEPPRRIVALKLLPADDACFSGHFPGYPVMPGVLIVEAMAQAAGILGAVSMPRVRDQDALRPYMLGIDKARFHRPVRPGAPLELHVTRSNGWGRFWRLRGHAFVADELVAEATLLAGLIGQDRSAQTESAEVQYDHA